LTQNIALIRDFMTVQRIVESLRADNLISEPDKEKAIEIIEANREFVEEILADRDHSSEEKSNAIQNLLDEDWGEGEAA
jgi:hypothetical protein